MKKLLMFVLAVTAIWAGIISLNSCQTMKDLGASAQEYYRLASDSAYLEQRWKEVVTEWEKEIEEQSLPLAQAKELLRQRLSDNQLLSLSSNHGYGNEAAMQREWKAYLSQKREPVIEKWRSDVLEGKISMEDAQDALRKIQEENSDFISARDASAEWDRLLKDIAERKRKAEEERLAAERKAREEERRAREERLAAERKVKEEREAAERKVKEEREAVEKGLLQQWRKEVIEAGLTDRDEALKKMVGLCVHSDMERNEKYYDDKNNFHRILNEANRLWYDSDIQQEAAKVAANVAHEKFMSMKEDKAFVFPATDICTSSIPLYKDLKSGTNRSIIEGTLSSTIADPLKEVNGRKIGWTHSCGFFASSGHSQGETTPEITYIYAYKDEKSATGVLVKVILEFDAKDVPLEVALKKYEPMGMNFNESDGRYLGKKDNLGIAISQCGFTNDKRFEAKMKAEISKGLFMDEWQARAEKFQAKFLFSGGNSEQIWTRIELWDIAQVEAYKQLLQKRLSEQKRAAEEAQQKKAADLLDF